MGIFMFNGAYQCALSIVPPLASDTRTGRSSTLTPVRCDQKLTCVILSCICGHVGTFCCALMRLNFYIGEIVDMVIFIDGGLKHRAQVSVLHHTTHRAFFNFVVVKMQKQGGRTIWQLPLANFDIQYRLRVIV